jgi:SAM-dependent methyltransferase
MVCGNARYGARSFAGDKRCQDMSDELHTQQNQPAGVPPLSLTGERTLPDVPEENYWFRRHLAVYEWVARRVHGLRVADLACGEGYGSDVLARSAAGVVGVDANPEAHEHARLCYRRDNLRFVRGLVEEFDEPCDAIVFLQTIEHIHDPGALLERVAGVAPLAFVTTPNRLTLAPPGAEKSENPWHVREYALDEYRELLFPHFSRVEVLGVFHARKLRAHTLALRAGWDRMHPALGITKAFYSRFDPAIASSDFRVTSDADLEGALDFLAVCRA